MPGLNPDEWKGMVHVHTRFSLQKFTRLEKQKICGSTIWEEYLSNMLLVSNDEEQRLARP